MKFVQSVAVLTLVACGGNVGADAPPAPGAPAPGASSPPFPGYTMWPSDETHETTKPEPAPSPFPPCTATTAGPCALLDLVESTDRYPNARLNGYPVIDDKDVYFVLDQGLSRVAKGASSPNVTSVATVISGPYFTVDANAIYLFTDATAGVSLKRMPKAGGPAETLSSGLASVGTIGVDATYAYVTAADAPGTAHVLRVPLAGGSPSTTLVTGSTYYALAVDETNLYTLSYTDLSSIPKSGGEATSLLHTATAGMALSDSTLYVSSLDSTKLARVSTIGTALAPLDVGTKNVRGHFAVQGGAAYVYDTTASALAIRRVPLDRSEVTKLETGDFDPASGVTADATGVYWVDYRFTCLQGWANNLGSSGCTKGRSELRVMRAPLVF